MGAILMVFQDSFTKFPCHVCFWVSRDTMAHYHNRDSGHSEQSLVRKNNVNSEPMLDARKVLFPPLHLKLILMKQLVDPHVKIHEYFTELLHIICQWTWAL
ncbi:hypothetical protein FHG87_011989 [Trinorchestia longiramus]|nr:hypothetical protein FHG87_011989 [Trinorchestia longiramus]